MKSKKLKFSARSIILIIASVIVVLGIAASFSWKPAPIKEGYNAVAGMESTISKTDFYAILNECVINVTNHEIMFSKLDSSYEQSPVSVDKQASDMENLQSLLIVMKKQDNKIRDMLPNYLPNKDLDGLMDGSLLTPVAKELVEKSTYAENPMDCDAEAITNAIEQYKELIKNTPGDDDASKNNRSVYNSGITQLQAKLIELNATAGKPGNTKCVPKLKPKDAEGILDGFYINQVTKIIKSHDAALGEIQNKIHARILDFYAADV